MEDGLRKEYASWYNQYYYTSIGLKKTEKNPEFDEQLYTEKLLSPVSELLGIALETVTLADVIRVLQFVKDIGFKFFWRVADLVSKNANSIPVDKRQEKLKMPFEEFLRGHTACYIMTKGGEPVIGYAKKRGELVGVDNDKFAKLGAVSRIRTSLSNIKGIMSTKPSQLSDVNRKMIAEMFRVGILKKNSLVTEEYPVPDGKGGAVEEKVTVLSPNLPSYAICTLIASLPQAVRNEYENPYKAALEFAKNSSDPKYNGLVCELKILTGDSEVKASVSKFDGDAYLKSLHYSTDMVESIKAGDITSRKEVYRLFNALGIDAATIDNLMSGSVSIDEIRSKISEPVDEAAIVKKYLSTYISSEDSVNKVMNHPGELFKRLDMTDDELIKHLIPAGTEMFNPLELNTLDGNLEKMGLSRELLSVPVENEENFQEFALKNYVCEVYGADDDTFMLVKDVLSGKDTLFKENGPIVLSAENVKDMDTNLAAIGYDRAKFFAWDLTNEQYKSNVLQMFICNGLGKDHETYEKVLSVLYGTSVSEETAKATDEYVAEALCKMFNIGQENTDAVRSQVFALSNGFGEHVHELAKLKQLLFGNAVDEAASAETVESVCEGITDMLCKIFSVKPDDVVNVNTYVNIITNKAGEGGVALDKLKQILVSDMEIPNVAPQNVDDVPCQVATTILDFMRSHVNADTSGTFKERAVPLQRILLPAFLASKDNYGSLSFLCNIVEGDVTDPEIKEVIQECKRIIGT